MKWSPRFLLLTMAVLVTGLVVWTVMSTPRFPVAEIRVVDSAGKPVAGAMIKPEGMRTKPGPYASGWYGWATGKDKPPNLPVETDKNGFASIPFPKYVFERIETGTLCLAVDHPDYVYDRPERVVATALPAGAPWSAIAENIRNRFWNKTLVAHPDQVVLKQGATLRLSLPINSAAPKDVKIFAQVSGESDAAKNFWLQPDRGTLITHRLAEGSQIVRAFEVDATGKVWFSDAITFTAVAGQTNEMPVDLKPGVVVRGQLDATARRPITRGRVVAHVSPKGSNPANSPPQWHTWTTVREDGSFEVGPLPNGNLEILALCDGYISTNGPGKSSLRHPQVAVLGPNDINITLGMEPTARLEVMITDDKGKPLKGAHVYAWPNVHYGDWGATIFAADCYNTIDSFIGPTDKGRRFRNEMLDFTGISDASGVAVVPNLPADVSSIAVEHEQFTLPAVADGFGQKRRNATVTLVAGTTNHASFQLEPVNRSPIKHY